MYTTKEIRHYASKSSVCKEVFLSIVFSKNSATRMAAIESFEVATRKVLKGFPLQSSVVDPVSSIDQCLSLEGLFKAFEVVAAKEENSFKGRLFLGTSFGRSIGLKLIAFIYDLDFAKITKMRQNSFEDYLEIGDAILLSGAFLRAK
jgi:hypothetical protein